MFWWVKKTAQGQQYPLPCYTHFGRIFPLCSTHKELSIRIAYFPLFRSCKINHHQHLHCNVFLIIVYCYNEFTFVVALLKLYNVIHSLIEKMNDNSWYKTQEFVVLKSAIKLYHSSHRGSLKFNNDKSRGKTHKTTCKTITLFVHRNVEFSHGFSIPYWI